MRTQFYIKKFNILKNISNTTDILFYIVFLIELYYYF